MKKILRIIPLFFLIACSKQVEAEQVAKVEQNFDKIKLGLNKEQVQRLLGSPRAIKRDIGPFNSLKCNKCELWIYPAEEGTIKWPQVAFETATNTVTKTFRAEPDEYFLF
jgi:hypothetical protein